ncbi:DUF6374 family protein [Nocardia sp. alder85J]|uniref:DUF6374 family protein n=1 Tax=Nocardia sp. alder85J TaxID=2862949 RepID=UPI001CD50ED1|nr:DUF6374 family protein [Nocardia sp. alder85J]MCX4095513.1 DUF6374 family protein [Nocardia sp. alder85J]
MAEPVRIPDAYQQIDQVRRQLIDAAAFSKHLTPEVLEHLAGTLALGLRLLADHPATTPGRPTGGGGHKHAGFLRYRMR